MFINIVYIDCPRNTNKENRDRAMPGQQFTEHTAPARVVITAEFCPAKYSDSSVLLQPVSSYLPTWKVGAGRD